MDAQRLYCILCEVEAYGYMEYCSVTLTENDELVLEFEFDDDDDYLGDDFITYMRSGHGMTSISPTVLALKLK